MDYNLALDYDGDYVYDVNIKAFRPPKYPGEKGDPITFEHNDVIIGINTGMGIDLYDIT